jgi:hypothetical protein
LKDNREASNPVESFSQHQLLISLDNSLVGNVLELALSTDEVLSNHVSKLDSGDEVAGTEAKALRDLRYSARIEGK